MRGKISIKFILIILFLFPLSFRSAFSSVNSSISLENVVFLKEPEKRLIFEFSNKPTYEILKEKNKLILKLSNTSIKNSNWISSLPKNIFREFNIALDNEKIILEFTLTKDFQISSEAFENKLMVNLILDEKKITHARIIRDRIETFSLADASLTPPNWPRRDDSPIKLPLTGNYTGAPISVDFQDADLRAIMRLFAEVGKINIVFAEPVNGTVTMRVSNVPWDLLFDAILNSFGLAKVNYNNLVVVRSIGRVKVETETLRDYLKSLKEYEEAGPLIMKIYHLKYAKAKEVANKISLIIGNLAEVKATQRELVTIKKEGNETKPEIMRLEFSIGRHGEKGSITFDESSQIVIVKTTPKLLQEIEKAIKALDRPAPQILIEARIVEVSDTYAHSFGVRWGGGAYRLTEKTLLGVGNLPKVTRDLYRSDTGSTETTERRNFQEGTQRERTAKADESSYTKTTDTTTNLNRGTESITDRSQSLLSRETTTENRRLSELLNERENLNLAEDLKRRLQSGENSDRDTYTWGWRQDVEDGPWIFQGGSRTKERETFDYTENYFKNELKNQSKNLDKSTSKDTTENIQKNRDAATNIQEVLKGTLKETTSEIVREIGSSVGTAVSDVLKNIFGDTITRTGINESGSTQTSGLGLTLPTGPLIDLGLDPTKPASRIGFSVGYLGKSLMIIDLELHALEEKGYARIFAKPRIVTTNNHPAEFKQGYRIPYPSVTKEGQPTTDFVEAVMGLRVTPHITPDNRIFMDVEVERTLPDWTRTVRGVPPLYTTLASTRVLVSSGETFVIGGIRLDDVRDSSEGIPWLSSIPGAGNLFKRTGKSTAKSEFMVFITPKIVTAEIEGVDY